MGDKLVVIASYQNAALAHIVKGRLEEEGIHAVVQEDSVFHFEPFYNPHARNARIMVQEGFVSKALEVLSDIDSDEPNG